MEYWSIIDERDYCEEGDLLGREYEGRGAGVEMEGELQVMRKWVDGESNAPMVVVGGRQSGKKTLLCAFLRQSKQRHPQWLHLGHFATITPHYAHILYKIMIALRNHYNVQQRVDLNEEKLRRYFKYWLELTSEMIDKEHLGYAREEVPKVVVVIEGIDQCRDSKGALVEAQFWLPHDIPHNIKLILSARELPDHAMPKATLLRHHLAHDKRTRILTKMQEKARIWAQQSSSDSLYHLQLVDRMVRSKPNFTPSSSPISTVVGEYISAVAANGCSAEEVRSVLYILTLTRKGLRAKWIQGMVGISEQKWGLFLRNFSLLIVQAEGYFLICNRAARELIKELVDPVGEKERTYRQSIAHAIRTEAGHLRELQEVVYQLFLCESYSELKEAISRVQNFALLYTPLSKDLLCQCWVRLEHLEQYDPVFEYNKAIEAYKSHYYPKEEDLYKIIFQLAMFFKEYAEFQSARTPEFRHPAIKGEVEQLVEIGIYEELKSLSMVGKCKIYKLKPLEKFSNPPKKEEKKEDGEERKERKTAGKVKKETRQSDTSQPLGLQTPKQQEQPSSEPLNIEQLNVSILANQQKFRTFFMSSMKEYLENYFSPLKKGGVKQKQLSFQSEQSDNEQQQARDRLEREPRLDAQKLKQSLILKKFKEFLQQSYHKTGQQVRYYYYKQWIWLQFPWICQTVKHIYSQMIKECLPGSIHFMSPLQEFRFVREVLRIARTAKESKLNIFTEKKIEMLPIKYSPEKLEQLQMKKKARAYDECSTVSRTKRTHQPEQNPNLSLSVNTLDELLFTEKKYEQTFREKGKGLRGQASSPNFPTFVTETLQKSKLLPSVSKSKFAKDPRGSEKENQNTSKDYTLVIRKYNEIKHENDMLLQKCEEMRRLSSQQVSKTKEEVEGLVGKIASIEERKVGLQRQFSQQAQLQKKLQVIIKICDLNKMYGSETEYLSTYLASLKEMIQLEEGRVKDLKAAVAELLDRSKAEVKELRRKRKDLKTQKEEHEKMYLNLGSDSTNMQYKSMPLQEIEEELREMDRSVKSKNKKERSKVERFFSSDDYDTIEGKLGFVYGGSDNDSMLKSFADKVDKRRQLQMKNSELQAQIKLHQRESSSVQTKLKNLQQASLNEKRMAATSALIEAKHSLSHVRHRAHLLTDAILSLA